MTRYGGAAVIAVASHTVCSLPVEPPYMPIYVGSALRPASALEAESMGFKRDDGGDSISSRNWGYSELTGLYWLWKNMDAGWKGIVHYRRYFRGARGGRLGLRELHALMREYRVIVPSKRRYFIETLESHYSHTHDGSHLVRMEEIIGKECPGYLSAYRRILGRTWGYMFNMLAMESGLIDSYCGWLFPLLFSLEKVTDTGGMTPYEARLFGRVSEILFNAWLLHKLDTGELKPAGIKELPVRLPGPTGWGRRPPS